ncbi:MAG: hypothetical protein F4186_01075, partial [Boseongicola sp. SB0676_bin_33]|nr:hypothetical protein [Boseongicola sp. SB0676_bin_33]
MRNSWGFELGTSDVRLMYRDDLAWAEVARARIKGPDFDERMKAMVALIEDDAAADLLFPRSQILYADVRVDPDSTTRQELERVLCEHMPHGTGELDLDWEVTVHGAVRVAAISVETLKEALDFASAQGIRVGELSSLADPVDFPRSPRFCGRDAEVPLASMIEDASISKARKIPIPGLIPAARMGGRLMHLLGTAGHRFPQRQRTGAMFAAALAAALGVAALLWTALPPESTTFEQALGKGPESGLATGAPVTGPELAAQAPESVDTESGLLLHQPPVAHTDARQLSGLWRRSELQAPAEGAGIAPAPLTKALASTQPRFPPLPTAGREAPQRADTASGLLLQQPPVVQADAGRLADLWRRSELQAPANGAGIFAEPLPTAQTLALPHVPPSPQAGHEAPQRVDIANGLLLQQPPDVHADAHQVADQWRQGQIRVPAGEVGMTAAPLPSSLALAQPHLPPSPPAGRGAPQREDAAIGLL